MREGVKPAVMAGQVKQTRFFSSLSPAGAREGSSIIAAKQYRLVDWCRRERLESAASTLVDSTTSLSRHSRGGVGWTRRDPGGRRSCRIRTWREHRAANSRNRLGQTVVVRDSECVAVEAWKGPTKKTSERASTNRGRIKVVVKVRKPTGNDMRSMYMSWV